MLGPIVAALEDKHGRGKEFYEALDLAVMNNDIHAALYASVKDAFRFTFILCGKFGQEFLCWMNRTSKPYAGYIVFPAEMRDGKQRSHEYCMLRDDQNWMRKACYLDSIIRTGVTRSTCIQRLAVPKSLDTYVVLDAMHAESAWCHSLHRDPGAVGSE